jgi:DNA invertase Pin-like site-specific DNA recombinase
MEAINTTINSTIQNKIVIAKYERCSTDKQELIIQDETLDKWINRYKEDNPSTEVIIESYKDEGISGKDLDRPSLKKMLDNISKHKINLVIFTKIDRLSRSLQDLLNTSTILKNNNVDFIVTQQNIDTTTPQGRLMFQIIGAFAEFERSMIYERMSNGRKKAELTGTKSGKPCHRPNVKIDSDGVEFKFKQGVSMNQISKQYNVSIGPIRRILKERGLIK